MKNIYHDLCLKFYGLKPEAINNKVYSDFVISLDDKFRRKNLIDRNRAFNIHEEKDFEVYLTSLIK